MNNNIFYRDLPLFEKTTSIKEQDPLNEHKKNLRRVAGNIRELVIEFCQKNIGRAFYQADLEAYVMARKRVAPGSPGRILRLLEQEGVISYELLSRSDSRYRVINVNLEEVLNGG